MMRITILALAMLMGSGCRVMRAFHIDVGGERGSGVGKLEQRSVGSFDGIAIKGAADLVWKQGTDQKVEVQTDDNLLPLFETQVRNGKLELQFTKPVNTRIRTVVTITSPNLLSLESSGSCDASLSGLSTKKFNLNLAGSGDATLMGQVDDLAVGLTGSGDIDAKGLTARSATVSIAGSGDVIVSASQSLVVQIAGSGDVRYRGNPQVTKSVMGSGEVSGMP